MHTTNITQLSNICLLRFLHVRPCCCSFHDSACIHPPRSVHGASDNGLSLWPHIYRCPVTSSNTFFVDTDPFYVMFRVLVSFAFYIFSTFYDSDVARWPCNPLPPCLQSQHWLSSTICLASVFLIGSDAFVLIGLRAFFYLAQEAFALLRLAAVSDQALRITIIW